MKRIFDLLGLLLIKYLILEKRMKANVDVIVLYLYIYSLIAILTFMYTGKESQINTLNIQIDSLEIANHIQYVSYKVTLDSMYNVEKTLKLQIDSLKSIPVSNKVVYPFIVGNEMDVNKLNDFIINYKVKAYRANGRKFNYIKAHFELNFPQ